MGWEQAFGVAGETLLGMPASHPGVPASESLALAFNPSFLCRQHWTAAGDGSST